MDELAKSLHFIIYSEINKILDNISIDYNISRDELNKYVDEQIDEIQCPTVNEDNIIDIPIISDDEPIDNANNGKCKQLTKKGKQCDYTAKPNSEYCGRHSK
jgi:hypothetical protein